jgi:predicted glycoside hydrolase/deacetylase ChbG (UPF0249 family)
MNLSRDLLVIADDFGIGPATSQAILDLAGRGLVTGTVLLVNSPYAEDAVRAWRRAGTPVELGWHPCLTLDRPVAPVDRVRSLVRGDGAFLPLAAWIAALLRREVRADEIAVELTAQYHRFRDLVGWPPTFVSTHHHVQIFPPVGAVLRPLLMDQRPRPYVRRIVEPWSTLVRVPGARGKRVVLATLGRADARRWKQAGFPGNDALAGIADPRCVADPRFLRRWLLRTPGRVVELTCHPGYLDMTLLGRDATADDGLLQRRTHELLLLQQPDFRETCRRAGFRLTAPSALRGRDEYRRAA